MKNYGRKILVLIIVALLAFIPGATGIASDEEAVDETVYALFSSGGSLKNMETVVRVESAKARFNYYGEFAEIKELTPGTEFDYDRQTLLWKTDKPGNDLYFKVENDEELPMEIDITHYLGGNEISPEEAAGEKGRYRMEVSIKPNPRANPEIVEKYMSQIQLQVDTEKARNIDCPDAAKVVTGKYIQLAWTVMPLSEAKFHIEYDTDKLETGEITITMTEYFDFVPGEFSELANGLDEVDGGMVMVSEALGKLKNGMTQGVSGLSELEEGLVEMADGASEFSKGLRGYGTGLGEFVNAVSGINSGLSGAAEGVSRIAENAKALYEGYSGLENGYGQVGESLNQITEMAQEIAQNGDEKDLQLYRGLQAAAQSLAQLNGDLSESNTGFAGLSTGISDASAGLNEISGGMGILVKEGGSVVRGYELLELNAGELISALNPAAKGFTEAVEGLSEIESGLYRIHESHLSLTDAVSRMNSEINAMFAEDTGTISFTDGRNQIRSLQFFIKVEGIGIKEQADGNPEAEEKSFWKNLWEKFKALF